MKNFKDIVEAKGDTAVFTFGRFNPPTTGHEKLIDAHLQNSSLRMLVQKCMSILHTHKTQRKTHYLMH